VCRNLLARLRCLDKVMMPSPSLQLRAKMVAKPAEGEEADPAFAPAPARGRLWSSGSQFDTDIDEPNLTRCCGLALCT
jgi:hypothetical protein